LLETTALSVGRGTDTPFEVIGAPYINDREFAKRSRRGAAAVSFVPVRFTRVPACTKYQLRVFCVNIVITDRGPGADYRKWGFWRQDAAPDVSRTDFHLDKSNNLLRDPGTIQALKEDASLETIKAAWSAGLKEIRNRRKNFLLTEFCSEFRV